MSERITEERVSDWKTKRYRVTFVHTQFHEMECDIPKSVTEMGNEDITDWIFQNGETVRIHEGDDWDAHEGPVPVAEE